MSSNHQVVAEIPQETLAGETTAGPVLRKLREQAGVELESLASYLKITPQKLRALEADELTKLPGVFFARGLASNVCRYLGYDAQPVLALMPDERPHIASDDESINEPVTHGRLADLVPRLGGGLSMPGWAVAVIVVALLAALLLFLLPTLTAKWQSRAADAASHASVAASQGLPSAAGASGVVQDASGTAGESGGLPRLAPAAVTTPASAAVAAAVPASATASSTQLPASGAVGAQAGLSLEASGEAWVQVRSASGKRLYERTLTAGQQDHVTIPAYPVKVTVGRVENVHLQDRGHPFDLSAIARTGVARFELK